MMTKRERIKAALAGEAVDRAPVAFWRHWPGDDQHPDSLAEAALEYQRRHDLDFIKFPVSSVYCVEDYGITHAYRGSIMGDREYLSRVIHTPDDWETIEPLEITKGTYGWHVESLRKVAERKNPDTPLIVTMFNPLSMAAYLAGDELLLAHLRQHTEAVRRALGALAETSARFARACIECGADGIFLSTRFASFEMMSAGEYLDVGRPADLKVLKAAGRGWFNVLHLHGQHPMLRELADYPVQAVNWHDRTSDIDLAAASGLFKGALMGGVDQHGLLLNGSAEQVAAQVRDAVAVTGGRRLIVTGGCTYSMGVPEVNLSAMQRAVGS